MKINICPKCKSKNVEKMTAGFLDIIGIGDNFVCRDCGFSSLVFPEVDVLDKKDLEVIKALTDNKEMHNKKRIIKL